MNIEQLEAQLAAAQQQAAEKRSNKVKEIEIKAKIKSLTDNALQERKAMIDYEDNSIKHLQALIQLTKDRVEDLHLVSKKKKVIEFNAYGLQGYGKVLELITGIINGLIYTREDVREEALNTLNISRPLAQALIDSYIVSPRFNAEEEQIELGQRGNVETFLSLIPLLETELDIGLPIKPVPQKVFDDIYERALARAEISKAQHEQALLKWESENKSLVIDLSVS